MHKHIAKAMKTHSKSIQAAIKAYNEAAAALRPPHCIIQWEEVLDLTFLYKFDLLHDSREDIQERQWATPKNRQIMLECAALEVDNPPLALQLQQHFQERNRFNTLHRHRLFAIKKLPGFDPHNQIYFRIGTYVEEPGDVWLEDAAGGEDDEDELNTQFFSEEDTN
ncbi:hypothetical protein F5051DRAFT_463852 [Lentinula edodes]|nr:hypothetical protein F5051DRAFT_463852 [Lentinula edodes]